MSTLVFTLEPRCIDTRERIPYERIEVERPQCQPAMTVDGAMVSRPLLIGFLGERVCNLGVQGLQPGKLGHTPFEVAVSP